MLMRLFTAKPQLACPRPDRVRGARAFKAARVLECRDVGAVHGWSGAGTEAGHWTTRWPTPGAGAPQAHRCIRRFKCCTGSQVQRSVQRYSRRRQRYWRRGQTRCCPRDRRSPQAISKIILYLSSSWSAASPLPRGMRAYWRSPSPAGAWWRFIHTRPALDTRTGGSCWPVLCRRTFGSCARLFPQSKLRAALSPFASHARLAKNQSRQEGGEILH